MWIVCTGSKRVRRDESRPGTVAGRQCRRRPAGLPPEYSFGWKEAILAKRSSSAQAEEVMWMTRSQQCVEAKWPVRFSAAGREKGQSRSPRRRQRTIATTHPLSKNTHSPNYFAPCRRDALGATQIKCIQFLDPCLARTSCPKNKYLHNMHASNSL